MSQSERLKSRKRIDQLFASGRKLSVPPFRVLYKEERNDGEALLQFGVGVSSRHFKKAVDRNRVKRLMREAWRIQKNELRAMVEKNGISLFVFVNYNHQELPGFEDVKVKMEKLIKVLTEQVFK